MITLSSKVWDQLQGILGNTRFSPSILLLWKQWGKTKEERIGVVSPHICIWRHTVCRTVLCSLCALSSILTTSEGVRGYCPHFADEEPETREVKDLPKGTQLILGWRQLLNPDLNGSNSYAVWVRHAWEVTSTATIVTKCQEFPAFWTVTDCSGLQWW